MGFVRLCSCTVTPKIKKIGLYLLSCVLLSIVVIIELIATKVEEIVVSLALFTNTPTLFLLVVSLISIGLILVRNSIIDSIGAIAIITRGGLSHSTTRISLLKPAEFVLTASLILSIHVLLVMLLCSIVWIALLLWSAGHVGSLPLYPWLLVLAAGRRWLSTTLTK